MRPLDAIPPTPDAHLRLLSYAAALALAEALIARAAEPEDALDPHPALALTLHELADFGLDGMEIPAARRRWAQMVREWEQRAPSPLPLTRLRAAGLDDADFALLALLALPDDAPRLLPAVEALAGAPTPHGLPLALIHSLSDDLPQTRKRLQRLARLGLVLPVDSADPALRPTPLLWDSLRGDDPLDLPPGLRLVPRAELTPLDALVLPPEPARRVRALPALIDSGGLGALIVRGPRHNGRRTLLGALAHALGRDALLLDAPVAATPLWQQAGTLALVRNALPILTLDLAPGESAALPAFAAPVSPLTVALGRSGALEAGSFAPALTLDLPLPDTAARRTLWATALPPTLTTPAALDEIASNARLSSGSIHTLAADAAALAAFEERETLALPDIRAAARRARAHTLERLAAPLPPLDDWGRLALPAETLRELRGLERRIRHREQMAELLGPAAAITNAGVRALFAGPSGTGKTLAARALAASLCMEIYRADLSTIVDKYIGETEKNLNRLFTQAEELDVILLLDEGDALLTQRTQVGNANDRYANLETNYLLQRLEAFEGVLLVTTNAGDRIDAAFQRRMDALIDFRLPDAAERWSIWELHLPPAHAVPFPLLQEVALRCKLTGGQIRNAALHALLLALEDDQVGRVAGAHLEAAVEREYRKAGTLCPLRRTAGDW